ncbi:MAG TPA: Smr/MutS family protein, partial [Nitrospiraceae bacterium]|nr:Smr/MutS family protein [Nitrospiraceae bacterium]
MSPRIKDRSDKPSGSQEFDSPFGDPVVVPIEDSIDLHAFSPKEIASVVEEYIEQCARAGIYEVRIIHG